MTCYTMRLPKTAWNVTWQKQKNSPFLQINFYIHWFINFKFAIGMKFFQYILCQKAINGDKWVVNMSSLYLFCIKYEVCSLPFILLEVCLVYSTHQLMSCSWHVVEGNSHKFQLRSPFFIQIIILRRIWYEHHVHVYYL